SMAKSIRGASLRDDPPCAQLILERARRVRGAGRRQAREAHASQDEPILHVAVEGGLGGRAVEEHAPDARVAAEESGEVVGDERLQGFLIDLVAFADVYRAPGVALEA